MRKRYLIWIALIFSVAFMGVAGNDDLQDEIATAQQTVEIKAAMKQRDSNEKRDAAAYRHLFLNRGD